MLRAGEKEEKLALSGRQKDKDRWETPRLSSSLIELATQGGPTLGPEDTDIAPS